MHQGDGERYRCLRDPCAHNSKRFTGQGIAHTCTKAIQRLLSHIALFCPRRLPHAVGADKRQRNETQTNSCSRGSTKLSAEQQLLRIVSSGAPSVRRMIGPGVLKTGAVTRQCWDRTPRACRSVAPSVRHRMPCISEEARPAGNGAAKILTCPVAWSAGAGTALTRHAHR